MSQVRHEDPAPYGVVSPSTSDDEIIEKAKAALMRRLKARRAHGDHQFTMPEASKDYLFLLLANRPQEVFTVLFLDSQNRLLYCDEMFTGTLDSASVYPREVARRALELRASAVVLGHNHPSGLTTPSDADKKITRRLVDALTLLGVRVLDHIVVGEGTYSFAENGDL